MKTKPKTMTLAIWITLTDETYVPLNPNGTHMFNRDTGSQGFASPTPKGAKKFERLFRAMSMKARAAGYKKVDAT